MGNGGLLPVGERRIWLWIATVVLFVLLALLAAGAAGVYWFYREANEAKQQLDSDIVCMTQSACEFHGQCSHLGTKGCGARNDKDCAKASVCRSEGRCIAKDGLCVSAK